MDTWASTTPAPPPALRPLRRRPRAWLLIAAAAVILVPVTTGAALAEDRSVSEIDAELRRLHAARRSVAAEVGSTSAALDAARAELATVRARLAEARDRQRVAEGQLALARNALDDAATQVEIAERNAATARDLLGRSEQQLAQEQGQLVDQLVAAYKYGAAGRAEMAIIMVRTARSPTELATNMHHLGVVIDEQDRAVEELTTLRAERAELAAGAARTEALVAEKREDAEETLEIERQLAVHATALTGQIQQDEREAARLAASIEAEFGEHATRLDTLDRTIAELDKERKAALARLNTSAGGMLCPVTPSWFQNDWGFPRSGGRTHKGTDVFADRGTPIVAMRDGTVKKVDRTDDYRPGSNRGDLGGRSVTYWVSGSEYWYFAHLEAVADGISVGAPLRAGQVIGWVGTSGNAHNTPPHAHVGRYVDGAAVNPYATLAAACRR